MILCTMPNLNSASAVTTKGKKKKQRQEETVSQGAGSLRFSIPVESAGFDFISMLSATNRVRSP